VKIACQAQLVNVIGLIRTEPAGPAWRQTIFHPFAHTARLARGQVLRADVLGPQHGTTRYGEVDTVDATATWDDDAGALAVFAVNRHPEHPVALDVDLRGLPPLELSEAMVLTDSDVRAVNRQADPDRVTPAPLEVSHHDGRVHLVLPAVSWTALSLSATAAA
jgi:alpha-N-arabinofuranosidase